MKRSDDLEEGSVVIVCAGPPYCELSENEAVKAQEDGCMWCSKIYIEPDGREIVIQPGLA